MLLGATDGPAQQNIDAGVGNDFHADVQMLLGMEDTGTSSATSLMGDQMLINVGGLLAVLVQIMPIHEPSGLHRRHPLRRELRRDAQRPGHHARLRLTSRPAPHCPDQ